MKPVLLDLPDDPQLWPDWLERQLIGLDLSDLVEQLQATVAEADESNPPSLEELLGGHWDAVLKSGLHDLSQKQLGQLMLHPSLLAELQDRILIDGGEYWDRVPLASAHLDAVARVRDRVLSEIVNDPVPKPESPSPPIPPRVSLRPKPKSPPRYWIPISIAAVVLLYLGYGFVQPRSSGWGFERPGVLAVDMSASGYLNMLADAAGDWFNKQTATEAELKKRIQEFRHGCDTLVAAAHPQLQVGDRDWLRERCRVWAGKLDNHLQDLAANTKLLDEIRDEADETILALQNALRARAAEVDESRI